MQTNSILYHALNPSLYQHNIRYFGRSAFEWAIFNGVTPVVRRMLEGVHPDNKLLELAIRHGHADVVRVLLDYGLHPDPAGWVYSVLGNKNKQKKFRKNPNRDEIEMEFLPLYLASQYNRQSVLRVLVSYARRSANYATATQQGTSTKPEQGRNGCPTYALDYISWGLVDENSALLWVYCSGEISCWSSTVHGQNLRKLWQFTLTGRSDRRTYGCGPLSAQRWSKSRYTY